MNLKKEKNISFGKKDLSKVILIDFNNNPIKASDLLKNPSVFFLDLPIVLIYAH